MTKTDSDQSSHPPSHPWTVPVVVSQIPDDGMHQAIEATPEQARQLASLAGIREVSRASAELYLRRVAGDRVHVTGHVRATLGQACVVTLDPIENDVDEPIDVIFAPPDQIPLTAKVIAREEGEDAEIPDPPEPIVSGKIDIGQLAAEILMLGIDPYPRKPGVVFEVPQEPDDPEDHPFAALKALQTPAPKSGRKKPKTH